MLDHIKSQLLIPGGGHPEPGEEPLATVRRETQEEFGLSNVNVLNNGKPFFLSQVLTGGLTPGHVDVDLWYLLEASIHDPINEQAPDFRKEYTGYKWYSLREILQLPLERLDMNMYRFATKLQSSSNP